MKSDDRPAFEWRVDRRLYWIGIVFLVYPILLVVFIISLAHPAKDWPPPGPVQLLFFGLLVAGTISSPWMLLFSRRAVLRLNVRHIEFRGAFLTKRINLSEVERVRWRRRPAKNGSVVLSGGQKRLVISFGWFADQDWREIVEALRLSLATRKHDDWERFISAIASRKDSRVPLPKSDLRLLIGSCAALICGIFSFWAFAARKNSGAAEFFWGTAFMVAFASSPALFLLTLWELIRYRVTKWAAAAVAVGALACVIVAKTIFKIITPN